MSTRLAGLGLIVVALLVIFGVTARSTPSSTPQASDGGEVGGVVHTYQWMSGDIYGETNTCRFAVSAPDQPLDIRPVGVVVTGTFRASADTYAPLAQQFQRAAASDSVSGRCDQI